MNSKKSSEMFCLVLFQNELLILKVAFYNFPETSDSGIDLVKRELNNSHLPQTSVPNNGCFKAGFSFTRCYFTLSHVKWVERRSPCSNFLGNKNS